MKLPGFLSPLGLQLAVAALLLVLIVTWFTGNQLFSPGPLSARNLSGEERGGITSHADLSSNCAACHSASWSGQSMNDRCIECHTDIQAEQRDPRSLHGLLQATDCRECHTEHRGPEGYLVDVEPREIDHVQFGFSLNAHQTTAADRPFACTDCHTESLTRFEPTLCESCHREEDPRFLEIHISEYGTNCRACHEGTDIFSADRFDHNLLTFPLLGKHAEARCVDCHLQVQSYAAFLDAPTTCAGCHLVDNPHPPTFGIDCARCHNSEGWETEIFDHNLAAFKLSGKHLQVACKQCHVNNVYRGTPATCISCHAKDDIHRGAFGNDCAMCHTTDTWKRGPFEHLFPLDHGGLGPIACITCHTTPGDFQAYTCYNCHNPEDIRRLHAFAEMMGTDITDCVRCHDRGQKTMQMH